jgi:FG-GAP-like repeat
LIGALVIALSSGPPASAELVRTGISSVEVLQAPAITTEPASSVTSNSAVLGSTVDPNNSPTTVTFEWTEATVTAQGDAQVVLSTLGPSHAAVIDVDGDGILDIVFTDTDGALPPPNRRVRWLRQSPVGTWLGPYLISSQDTNGIKYKELESLAAADFDTDGRVEVVIIDQSSGLVRMITQDGEDPTGTWTARRILRPQTRKGAQDTRVYDVDGNGSLEVVYAWEGLAGNQSGGVNCLRWNGGPVSNPSSWSDVQLAPLMGAWGLARNSLVDGTDLVATSRRGKNSAAPTGVYLLQRPEGDPFAQTWGIVTLEDRVSDWLHVDTGNFFGDGHAEDVVAQDLRGIAPDDETRPRYGVVVYRKSQNWAKTTLVDPMPTRKTFNLRAMLITDAERHDIMIVKDNDAAWLFSPTTTPGGFRPAYSLFPFTKSHPADAEIHHVDIDVDGQEEIVLPDSGGGRLYSVQVSTLESDPAQPQFARPDADVSVGNWVTAPLWSKIDEVIPVDTDSARGPVGASGTSEIGLSDLTDPGPSGLMRVRYRFSKDSAGGQPVDLTLELVQGASVIASWAHLNITNVWTQVEQTLTAQQLAQITDFADLRLRLTQQVGTGNPRRVRVSWAEVEARAGYPNQTPGVNNPETGDGSRPHPEPLLGLDADTLYFYRAKAASAGGTVVGAEQSFRTAP